MFFYILFGWIVFYAYYYYIDVIFFWFLALFDDYDIFVTIMVPILPVLPYINNFIVFFYLIVFDYVVALPNPFASSIYKLSLSFIDISAIKLLGYLLLSGNILIFFLNIYPYFLEMI